MSISIEDPVVKIDTRVKKSPRWKIIFLNNDVTPMELVVHILCRIYGFSTDKAVHTMLQIHYNNSDVVFVGSKELCELKYEQTHDIIRLARDPLQVLLQPDSEDN